MKLSIPKIFLFHRNYRIRCTNKLSLRRYLISLANDSDLIMTYTSLRLKKVDSFKQARAAHGKRGIMQYGPKPEDIFIGQIDAREDSVHFRTDGGSNIILWYGLRDRCSEHEAYVFV